MNKNIRYKRGTVWYYVDEKYIMKSKNNAKDNITHGSRPVLIYSSDESNATNSNVIVLKISSKVQKESSINIKIMNDNDCCNIVLCNEIMEVPKVNLIDYQYTICDEDMMKIERGVMIATGTTRYLQNYDCQYSIEQLKSIVNGMVSQKLHEVHRDDAMVTVKYIQNVIDGLQTKSVEPKKISYESVEASNKVDSKDTSSLKKIKRPRKHVWTLAIARDYINDYYKLTPKDMKSKYNLNSVGDVSKYLSYLKKKFGDQIVTDIDVRS